MNEKKVICFIDSFCSGGAQKQMVMLANGLNKSFIVKTLQYHDLNFFSNSLESNIEQHKILSSNKIKRIFKILHFLYKEKPDVIISFLNGPNNYAAISKLVFFWRNTKLIVGERNLNIKPFGFKDLSLRISHLFANKIVCNSNAQKEKLQPYFKNKLVFIPNGTKIENIQTKNYQNFKVRDSLKLVVAARFIDQKNPLGLLKALKETDNVTIYWYGELFKEYDIYKTCIQFIVNNQLENRFIFMAPTNNIYEEMIKYDGLILPSFYEGCPNAIVDAMYCGLAVLASDVSDNKLYLSHQKELVFDPSSAEDIVAKLKYFKTLSSEDLTKIGKSNITNAKLFFNSEIMVSNYVTLFL